MRISINGPASEELLVEVKVRDDCPITKWQKSGYKKPDALVFLAPRTWKHIGEVPGGSKVKHWNCLAVNLADWLEKDGELRSDPLYPVFREFQQLLGLAFPSIRLTISEVQMIASAQREGLISFVLKAPRIVDALKKRFDGLTIGGTTLTIEDDETPDSGYGFNIKTRKKYLLWVGIWKEAGLLLGAGHKIGPDWKASKPMDGFTPFVDETCHSYDRDWQILSLDENLLDTQKDVVDAVSLRLHAILESMLAAG